MDREQAIKDKFAQAAELTSDAHDLAKKYVKDTSIPLDVRWRFFVKYSLGHQESWVYHPESLDDFNTPYGSNAIADRYMLSGERREIVYFSNVISNLEADIGKFVVVNKEPVSITEEHVSKFKEEILKNYVNSFILDW